MLRGAPGARSHSAMRFSSEQLLRRLPSPRTFVAIYCVIGIVLDFYFKYSPDLPLCHLLTGTSPSLELLVLGAVLMGTAKHNKLAFYVCALDTVLGFICLLTLPVISTAENATGQQLHLPFVSTFHSSLEFHVTSPRDLLFVTIILGFFSTFLVLLFLSLDLLKLMLLIRMCRDDVKMTDKISSVEAQNPAIIKY